MDTHSTSAKQAFQHPAVDSQFENNDPAASLQLGLLAAVRTEESILNGSKYGVKNIQQFSLFSEAELGALGSS